MAASPLIQFRATRKSLASELEQRSGMEGSVSDIAERDLERYYYLLRLTLAKLSFSMGEAMLLCDVMNGTINQPYTVSLIWASVSDALKEGYAEKWNVDGPALVQKLRSLSPFECMAVADAIEQAWNDETYRVANMEERVKKVGLVKEAE